MTDSYQNSEVIALPDIIEVEFTKIDKNYFKVILINFFLIFILLFVGLILLDEYTFTEEIAAYSNYIYASFTVFFGLIFLFLLLSFSKRMYVLRDKDISYKAGLFTKTITTVPFSRIQHVEIDEKPFSRIFNLASISVFTAGDSSDDLDIKGINKEKALQIKEFISTKIDE